MSPRLAFVLSIGLFAFASSGASAQELDVAIDATDLDISLATTVDRSGRRPKGLYQVRYAITLAGEDVHSRDIVKFEWMKGRRVLAEARCPVSILHGGRIERLRCETERTLETDGEHRVRISYIEQSNDITKVLHDATLNVITGSDWIGMERNRPVHTTTYQIDGDDFLGFAHVEQMPVYDGPGRFKVYFWASHSESMLTRGNYAFRCKEEGADRWTAYRTNGRVMNNQQPQLHLENRVHDGREVHDEDLYWTRWVMDVENVPMSVEGSGVVLATEHVGETQQICQIRRDGTVVREFRFQTNAQGQIRTHAVQNAGLFAGQQSVVEVYFPEAGELGPSFDPNAIRRSYGMGRPWPSDEAMAAELSALPSRTVRPRLTRARGRR